MTLAIARPTKGRRIQPAPPMPSTVHIAHRPAGEAYLAHRTTDCAAVRSAFPLPLVVARQEHVTWCAEETCWPGNRCDCGEPSGSRPQCHDCDQHDRRAEKRRDAVGWDAA